MIQRLKVGSEVVTFCTRRDLIGNKGLVNRQVIIEEDSMLSKGEE